MNTTLKRTLIILLIVAISLGVGFTADLIWDNIDRRLHPRSYEEIIADASREFDVPEEIIYATIKVESGFDPEAVSSAGAVGLMQMMPDTFEELTGVYHLNENLPTSALKDPEVSIRYGTYYLSYLFRYFDYNWEYASIAYNAGMGRLTQWLRDPAYTDEEGNLKKIPYPETKSYIKKINQAIDTYRDLYGEDILNTAKTP
ncbi:MAG: lytic transglycosylase domain-containing protein [Ruminococcaceae bacterium]|nr:lytic transglycosylase domain-containing protein [Oscillospiraceae bacterium]